MPKKPPQTSELQRSGLLKIPKELQVNILTFLRAFDLAVVQRTCSFYNNPELVHAIVVHTAEHVYPSDLTVGFDQQPLVYSGASSASNCKDRVGVSGADDDEVSTRYNFEHLRNMELLVVARVLSRPEPKTGFIVSKSWCKTALRWLEVEQEKKVERQQLQQRPKKKLSKKKQRLRERRLSDASPPWPNVNSDILCEHQNLQRCSSGKSNRARRRLMDKHSWKILNKLYPNSTQLASAVGECLQCRLEFETARKSEQDRLEQAKLERKRPLENRSIRRFYTRTRCVPVQCLRSQRNSNTKAPPVKIGTNSLDSKMPAKTTSSSSTRCPLQPGIYYLIPRAWCHGWRHYMKTGEGGGSFPPPDASDLLCDKHGIPLLPPHLEAYLYGESSQLVALTATHTTAATAVARGSVSASAPPAFVPGQAPSEATVEALRAAGLSSGELNLQLAAMRRLEIDNSGYRPPTSTVASLSSHPSSPAAASPPQYSRNELLDRENHSVVEIVSEEEYSALLEKCWPDKSVFSLSFDVDEAGTVTFSTPPCRDCDATGRRCSVIVKNRARNWVKKSAGQRSSVEKARAPQAGLEY